MATMGRIVAQTIIGRKCAASAGLAGCRWQLPRIPLAPAARHREADAGRFSETALRGPSLPHAGVANSDPSTPRASVGLASEGTRPGGCRAAP